MSTNKENTRNGNEQFDGYAASTLKSIPFKNVKVPVSPIVSYEYQDGTPYVVDPNKRKKLQKHSVSNNKVSSPQTSHLTPPPINTTVSHGAKISKSKKNSFEATNSGMNECKSETTDATDGSERSSSNFMISSLKQQLTEKDKEISQLRKLVNGMNIENDTNQSVTTNDTSQDLKSSLKNLNKAGDTRKVSFSNVYTVLESDPIASEHYVTRTVETPSLLRHNRPPTPHPNEKVVRRLANKARIERDNRQTDTDNEEQNKQKHAEIVDPTFRYHSVSTRRNFRTTPKPSTKTGTRLQSTGGNSNENFGSMARMSSKTRVVHEERESIDSNHLKPPKMNPEASKYDGYMKERPKYLTPAKIHYANVPHDAETPKSYQDLMYALTPGALDTESAVSYNEKFSLKSDKVANKSGQPAESATAAAVAADMDSVLQATESIHGTMSRLPQDGKKESNGVDFSELDHILAAARSRAALIDENINNSNEATSARAVNEDSFGGHSGNDFSSSNPAASSSQESAFEFDWNRKGSKKKSQGFAFMKH